MIAKCLRSDAAEEEDEGAPEETKARCIRLTDIN
jgi:hypothetical protein